MASEATRDDAVPVRKAKRSLLRIFTMGLGAPALLVSGAQIESRSLRRGETVDHAWRSVGDSLSRSMRRIAHEQRTGQRSA